MTGISGILASAGWLALIVGVTSCVGSGVVPCGEGLCPPGYDCVQSSCVLPERRNLCGNGIKEDGEVCDDGNTEGGDGCSADCRSDETCGNGIVDEGLGEQCDCGDAGVAGEDPACEGQNNAPDTGYCRTDCWKHCGDGEVNAEEVCDVAAAVGEDSCVDLRYDKGRLSCSTTCDGLVTDACQDWNGELAVTSITSQLRAVWAGGPDRIVAVGNGGVVLRHDGTQWRADPAAKEIEHNLRGVQGRGDGELFAVGYSGAVLRFDGGAWRSISDTLDPGERLRALWVSESHGVFVVGGFRDGVMFHYREPGWQSPEEFPDDVGALRGVWGHESGSELAVFAVGDAGTIVHSSDGATWERQDSGTPGRLAGVWGSGPKDVFAVGDEGTILRHDGMNWTGMESGTTVQLRAVWGTDRDDVYAAGDLGTLLHYDGNADGRWEVIEIPTTERLQGIVGVESSDGLEVIVVGNAGTILHHRRQDWQFWTLATEGKLRGLWGSGQGESGPDRVLAVGDCGKIFHYRSGRWRDERSAIACTDDDPGEQRLRAVWDNGSEEAYAVGDGWTVLTRDQQGLWSSVGDLPGARLPATGSRNFRDIWGYAAGESTHIFAVGDQGTVVHHDGSSWAYERASDNGLHGVWGHGFEDVYAVGDAGTVIHYNGVGWEPVDTGIAGLTEGLTDIWGSEDGELFVVGDAGTILHHDGMDWERMFSLIRDDLVAVSGNAANDVIAVGRNGTLLHHDGISWLPMSSGTTEVLFAVWSHPGSRDAFIAGRAGRVGRLIPPEPADRATSR